MAENNGQGCLGCLGVIVLCIAAYAMFHVGGDKSEAQQAAIEGDAQPGVTQAAVAAVSLGREFDEDAARDAAHDDLSGQSYESEQGSSQCTDDCSGHEAGWSYARDNGDEDCDSGASDSFREGCSAYREAVEQRIENAREAYNKGDAAFVKD